MKSLNLGSGSLWRRLATVGLLFSASGCAEEGEQEALPEVLLERATAFRMACAASVLEQIAAEDLEILEATAGFYQQSDSGSSGTAPTAKAAVLYARGYLQHARLRAGGYAMLDSAVNYSASPEDSIRFTELATGYAIRAPAEGTIERNVLESYQANLATILGDFDHRCNWDIPGLESDA